jgi:hypothetical protein
MLNIEIKRQSWRKMKKSKLDLIKLIEYYIQCCKAESKSP